MDEARLLAFAFPFALTLTLTLAGLLSTLLLAFTLAFAFSFTLVFVRHSILFCCLPVSWASSLIPAKRIGLQALDMLKVER